METKYKNLFVTTVTLNGMQQHSLLKSLDNICSIVYTVYYILCDTYCILYSVYYVIYIV